MLSWRVDGVVLGVVPHNFVNLILHSTDVCCMRLVFTTWMHIIDVFRVGVDIGAIRSRGYILGVGGMVRIVCMSSCVSEIY